MGPDRVEPPFILGVVAEGSDWSPFRVSRGVAPVQRAELSKGELPEIGGGILGLGTKFSLSPSASGCF